MAHSYVHCYKILRFATHDSPKRALGKFQVIHRLSFPHGGSVNDGIPKEFASVQYATINHAIQHIKDILTDDR